MTTTVRHRIRLHRPADLLAALPHVLGFHPEDSLIAILISREKPARIDGALRLDLPEAGQPGVLDQLAAVVRARRPSAVVLAVIGGHVPDDGPPARPDVVAELTETLVRHGLSVPHALWAERLELGASWRCYQHADCGGELPDPSGTELAAVHAADGFVTFASRDELVALLTPDDPAALARRANRLGAAQDAAELDRALHDREAVRREFRMVLDAVQRVGQGRAHLTDDDVVALAVALGDHHVRDLCLGTALNSFAAAAEQLWLILTRSTPEPERAEPATLLGYAAFVRGDGALAGIALDRALEAYPAHTLARLLRQAMDSGVPPDKLRGLAMDAAAELGFDLTEPDLP